MNRRIPQPLKELQRNNPGIGDRPQVLLENARFLSDAEIAETAARAKTFGESALLSLKLNAGPGGLPGVFTEDDRVNHLYGKELMRSVRARNILLHRANMSENDPTQDQDVHAWDAILPAVVGQA